MRRAPGEPVMGRRLRFGPWVLDSDRRRLTHDDGHEEPLTNAEFRLPSVMLARPRFVLTANGGSFTGGDVRIAIQSLLPTAPAA